jgi:opacity protein-like surface antigen
MNKKEDKNLKRIYLLVTFIVVVVFSTNALAQNNDQVQSDRPYNREGIYVGLQGSYNEGNGEWHNGVDFNHNINGGMGGLFIGFYYQTPLKIVYGLEMEGNLGSIGARTSCPNTDYSCHTDVGWTISARGRLGFALGPFLPYVAAGVVFGGAYAEVKYLPTDETYKSYDNNLIGLTPGIGLDLAITKNIFIRAEYSYNYFFPSKVTIDEVDKYIQIDYSVFKVGLGGRF